MNEKIELFIPDASYGNTDRYPDLDEQEASSRFKEELRAQLEEFEKTSSEIKLKPLLQANIGAGADLPAFLAEIMPHLPLAGGVALFFMGKKINENLDAWASIGKKIAALTKLTNGCLNRGAAFLASLAKATEKFSSAESIQILQYETVDGRFEQNWKQLTFEKRSLIAQDLPQEYRAGQIHYFRILLDDKEIEILVYGDEIEIRVSQ